MVAHDVLSLNGKVHDPNRIAFLNRYLNEFEKATDDGVDIAGYSKGSFWIIWNGPKDMQVVSELNT